MAKRTAKKNETAAPVLTGPVGGIVYHVHFRFETDRARAAFASKMEESYMHCVFAADGTVYYEGSEPCETAMNAAAECDFGNEIGTIRCDRR